MSHFATFNELAELELNEVVDYYESESKGLGERFLAAVEVALDLVMEHPQAGAPVRGDVRRKALGRFRYQLLYRQHGENIMEQNRGCTRPACVVAAGQCAA